MEGGRKGRREGGREEGGREELREGRREGGNVRMSHLLVYTDLKSILPVQMFLTPPNCNDKDM